jgi:RNA polymerase sigma-70 factor (ECF subfamily)
VNELLSRFRDGNVEAFEALFRQFQAEVYGWIVRIVRDPGAAEDLTVETFWRIYRSHHRFNPEAPFSPWARRIATNLAIDHLRRTRPEVELPEHVPQAASPDPIFSQEMRERIVAAFRRLPLKLRVAALLSLVEERSHQEIAEALGTSEGAIKLRVFRAVRLLREQLTKAGMKP